MTSTATIATYLVTNWNDTLYPIAEGRDWTADPAIGAWNLVERVHVEYPASNGRKVGTYRIWLENKVEAAIDALITLLHSLTDMLFVHKLATHRNGDYYQAIIDIETSD